MYKIAEERFQELYSKYANNSITKDYVYYLNSVFENGTNLFDVPEIYQTNEMIMTAIETPNNHVHLISRMTLENCVDKELGQIAQFYHRQITENDREQCLTNFRNIINYYYDGKYHDNYIFYEQKLYTFIDFFQSIVAYFSGLDTICYVYLYREISIPIRLLENNKKQNFKLSYDAKLKELHLTKISAKEYKQLRDELNAKLDSYYSNSVYLTEYCWEKAPTDLDTIPILQDGEYYETFKTTEKDGVIYDFSQTQIISVSQDKVDFCIPEGVKTLSERCFMGNKNLKRVKFPSNIKSIPIAAFLDCVSLEEVDLSQTETSSYSKIIVGSAAFCNCRSLKKIDFSKLKLQDNAQLTFAYCNGIESIKELELSGFANNIKMNFFHCENLKVLVKQDYPNYGEFDLAYCLGLKEATIPRNNIKFGLFCGCENLEYVEITKNCNFTITIEDYCFAGCKSLVAVDTLIGGVKIDDYAFLDCISLEKIVISKKDEFFSKLSPSAFIGCPNFIIEWFDNSRYPSKETIEAYWKRKGIEVDEKKRREKLVGVKYKERLLKVYDETINIDLDKKRNEIGLFFKKEGKYIGTILMHIFKYDLCTWGEYLKIGRVFYESIPLSSMDDEIDIRTAVVYWAKTCTLQAYLKAPFHNKFDAIQQIYNILKLAHCYFKNNKVVYGEKASEYAEYDVLNTYFDYEKIEERATEEQKAFIEKYTSFSDVRMSYMMQCYLLKHLIAYNTIKDNKEWYYEYANKEIAKLSNHAYSFGNITPSFFNELCRNTWQQFIKNDIGKVFEELGQDDLDFESNTAYYISFDESCGEICRKAESISNSRPLGVNLMIPDDGYSYNSQYNEEYNGYGRYAGTYAQDEMGYSDDDIDTIFDGNPDAYWNID